VIACFSQQKHTATSALRALSNDVLADLHSACGLQRRLARAGYYHGAIDGIMGPATRRAIRAYERTHNPSAYGMTDRY
jgi:peptidoglycan hydrolase-like protein with peptidoglycan-binding domain